MVAVNGLEAAKITAEIKNGDKITVRKFGKFVVDSTDRITKKGRIAFEYRKYI
jgi:RNA-binding protein YlmH